jgi:hypothetical protein
MKQKMKTAMQEVLEWVRATLPMDLETPQMIERKIESLLEKEKEMLAGVWLDAQVAYQGDEYIKPSDPTFVEYYEETFNTK